MNELFDYEFNSEFMFDYEIDPDLYGRILKFKAGEPYIFYPKENLIPPIEKIIFNPPATIVFWDDGEKTVVKCKESEEFDYECGLAFAIAKRYFGSRSEFKKAIGKAKKITKKDMHNSKRKNIADDVAAKIHDDMCNDEGIGYSDITGAELRLTNSYIDERLRDFFLGKIDVSKD